MESRRQLLPVLTPKLARALLYSCRVARSIFAARFFVLNLASRDALRMVLERGRFGDIIEEKLMLTITAATVIGLSLAGMVLMKSQSTDSEQFEQPRPALLTR